MMLIFFCYYQHASSQVHEIVENTTRTRDGQSYLKKSSFGFCYLTLLQKFQTSQVVMVSQRDQGQFPMTDNEFELLGPTC